MKTAFQVRRGVTPPYPYPPRGVGFVYHADFPERYVRDKSERGWMYCDACGRQFKLWMTTYQNWERLPRKLWPRVLCTRCYREAVR